MRWQFILPIVFTAFFASFLGMWICKHNYKPQIKVITKTQTKTIVKKIKPNYIETISKEDLVKDLKQYSYLSDEKRNELVNTIYQAAKKFNIPPIILYSIIASESSFRWWITHNPVTIKVNGKSIKTNAIGLGGVIYEIHGKDLKKANIIKAKGDLYDPIKNIYATAYIYKQYLKFPKKKSAKTIYESALLRYYGGSYKSYVKKIQNQIGGIVLNKYK